MAVVYSVWVPSSLRSPQPRMSSPETWFHHDVPLQRCTLLVPMPVRSVRQCPDTRRQMATVAVTPLDDQW